MSVELHSVVPWGRTFDEYRRMFALSNSDLEGRILGCADGPSSFNSEAALRSHTVVSCDPIYRFDADTIRGRIAETFSLVVEQTERNRDIFVWKEFRSVDDLARVRSGAMERFLDDFARGGSEGRYLAAGLPELPFPDRAFDLALCSHFLFLYSDHLSEGFHVRSVLELCRVARTVRVFPLLDLACARSSHLEPVLASLADRGIPAGIEEVPYEFQRGGRHMLAAGGPASPRPRR